MKLFSRNLFSYRNYFYFCNAENGRLWQVYETGHAPSLQRNVEMQRISHRKGKLSIVIGGIKSAISRYANAHNITFGWQARFHDRIIRNHQELNNVAAYIEQNVSRWNDDEFNMKSS